MCGVLAASRWRAQGSTLGAPEVLEPRSAQHLLPPSPPCDFLPLAHSARLGQTTSLCTFISPFPAHFPTPPRTGPSPRAAAALGLGKGTQSRPRTSGLQGVRGLGIFLKHTSRGATSCPRGDGTRGWDSGPGEGHSRGSWVHHSPGAKLGRQQGARPTPRWQHPSHSLPTRGPPSPAIPRTPPHIPGVPIVSPLAQEDQDESP